MSLQALEKRETREHQGSDERFEAGFDRRFTAAHFVHELAPTRLRSFGGDVLVEQVRRTESRNLQTYRSITLGRIGRRTVVPDFRQHPQTGQALALQSRLRITKLPGFVPAGWWTISVRNGVLHVDGIKYLTSAGDGRVTMLHENYSDQRGAGETVVLGLGEYVQVESSRGKYSVSWSSDLSLPDFLDVVGDERAHLGTADPADTSYLEILSADGATETATGPAGDVLAYVRAKSPHVQYISLSHENGTVVWSTPTVRVKGTGEAHAEVALVVRRLDMDALKSLVSATASRAVQENTAELFSRFGQFSKYL